MNPRNALEDIAQTLKTSGYTITGSIVTQSILSS
jgi:hypothetical protein